MGRAWKYQFKQASLAAAKRACEPKSERDGALRVRRLLLKRGKIVQGSTYVRKADRVRDASSLFARVNWVGGWSSQVGRCQSWRDMLGQKKSFALGGYENFNWSSKRWLKKATTERREIKLKETWEVKTRQDECRGLDHCWMHVLSTFALFFGKRCVKTIFVALKRSVQSSQEPIRFQSLKDDWTPFRLKWVNKTDTWPYQLAMAIVLRRHR